MNEAFWNTCKTKLWAQSVQQFGQCGLPGGMEESALWEDKASVSSWVQWDKSFSPQPNNKQSPGNMHRRNHISKILLRPFFKNLVLHMLFKWRPKNFRKSHYLEWYLSPYFKSKQKIIFDLLYKSIEVYYRLNNDLTNLLN